MFRCGFSAIRCVRPLGNSYIKTARIIYNDHKNFATLNKVCWNNLPNIAVPNGSLTNNKQILDLSKNLTPIRTVTKFSFQKGKRKTVKAAIKRFFRLEWGGWIRPKVARKKKLWTKTSARKRRLRQHVFCTASQTTLLDKMVTKCWKRPKHYVEDPYAPYHTREEFFMTRKKPIVRE